MLDRFQRGAFSYFLDHVNPDNGLVADRSIEGSPASIAVVGFALSSYPVGVERGWMTRQDAAAVTLATLHFLMESRQGRQIDATGYKGFYYHFLDRASGKRAWNCELSMVDTALLMAGVLVAGAYFDGKDPDEAEIRSLADALYARVEWDWAQDGKATLRQGWKPRSGFLRYGWDGYNEATILYVLGLGSPGHPVSDDSYAAWASTYRWEALYGRHVLCGGPLFMHQFSHAWIDFSGIRDSFMRDKDSDYFENSRRATLVHRDYARENPQAYAGYCEDFWGLSASDGPGRFRRRIDGRSRRFYGYKARGAPFGPDDGTIAPWSYLASLPFAPEICLSGLRHLLQTYPHLVEKDRLPSGFNPTLTEPDCPDGWISEGHFGLDQGIVVLMIENYRSGLIWDLMRSASPIANGLRKAGFTGGWLAERTEPRRKKDA